MLDRLNHLNLAYIPLFILVCVGIGIGLSWLTDRRRR